MQTLQESLSVALPSSTGRIRILGEWFMLESVLYTLTKTSSAFKEVKYTLLGEFNE